MNVKLRSVIVLLLGFLAVCSIPLNGHQYSVPLIIDTDMGLDDARALVMLLNLDMADILLAVTTDGSVNPDAGHANIEALFSLFPGKGASHIPVVSGRDLGKKSPPWRQWSTEIFSFHKPTLKPQNRKTKYKNLPAARAIIDVLQKRETPCIYLCLGPCTSLADALEKEPGIAEKISRVIYYGTPYGHTPADWNTSRHLEAARKVFSSGLKVYTLSSRFMEPLPFSPEFFQKIKALDTPASRIFTRLHAHPAASKLLSKNHFKIWDELAVIYLERPELFRFEKGEKNIYNLAGVEKEKVYEAYIKMMGYGADGHLREREPVVLRSFPVKSVDFRTDVAPYVKKIIETHGLEEWKACVLTNMLHRHLGTYSLIGAKMGIRAREILDAPLDNVKVISYAGLEPPLSCMNDGLQVSTGASLGRGTIRISDQMKRPAARFTYKDRTVTLALKASVVQQIKKDIAAAVKKYGGITPEYFKHIRKLSIRSWYTLDRMQIFEVK